MPTRDLILSYLMRAAPALWGLGQEPTDNHWHLLCAGAGADFDVHVTFSEGWAYFQAPVLKVPAFAECAPGLSLYLLRCNEEMLLARFGLDDQGQVVLSAEWPLESFDFAAFRHLSEVFVAYLSHYAAEVRLLSRDARMANFVMTGQLAMTDEFRVNLR